MDYSLLTAAHVLDAIPDAVLVVGLDGVILTANVHCEAVLGYRPDELVGTSVDMLIPEELRVTHASQQRAYFAAEPRVRPMGGDLELRALHHHGYCIPVEISLAPVLAADGAAEMAVAVIRDMTERQELEEKLRQSQKMDAVGQLAGGIAHDFNNLLTVISGYAEILGRRVGSEGNGSRELVEIGKAAERAAELTRQILAYSRKQALKPRVLDLNDLVAEVQAMLERLIGEHIEFSTTLAEDLGSISADNGQIEQIIMNLVVNARDAMPEGGKLLLETRNLTLADSTNRRPDMPPGDYVVFAVTDSGQGMDAATVGRIFEPFYTTKARDAGTGLGLSTDYGIVKQSGGHVEVESDPGIGTSFRLYFPQVAEMAEAVVPKPPDERPLTGSETILLVEDEEALRGIGKQMLETYGYTVLLAADGAAGLELAQNHPHPIQLLMTDILMPKMGGIELAERLSTLDPKLKVLYTSGYNDSEGSLQMVARTRYLPKPYAMKELAHTLRELLD
jgi:two-component system, cell cycle sensor histidine kinase and response regulator CckA